MIQFRPAELFYTLRVTCNYNLFFKPTDIHAFTLFQRICSVNTPKF